MTTKRSASASDVASSDGETCGGGSGSGSGNTLASRLRLKKLTTVKIPQATQVTTKTSSPSKYFTPSSNRGGGKLNGSKRKRVSVKNACDAERSSDHRNAECKTVRPVRNKRQSCEAVQETVEKKVHRKKMELEVLPKSEVNALTSDPVHPSCSSLQASVEIHDTAFEDSNGANSSVSSSDVEWEDVEGMIN